MMNESERVKSKAMIDSSDSDSEVSDSEFQNVAKKPKLDPAAVRVLIIDLFVMTTLLVEVCLLTVAEEIFFLQQQLLLGFRR